MTSLDFLYYSLAIGFLLLIGIISYAFLMLAFALKAIRMLIGKTEDITQNTIKEKVKPGILSTILGIVSIFFGRGGVRYGQR